MLGNPVSGLDQLPAAEGAEKGVPNSVTSSRDDSQTLGYGLADSPAGLAAWIYDKFAACTYSGGEPERVLTRDEMRYDITLSLLGHQQRDVDTGSHQVLDQRGCRASRGRFGGRPDLLGTAIRSGAHKAEGHIIGA